MGLFDYFRRRRQRESAAQTLVAEVDPSQHLGALSAGGAADPREVAGGAVQPAGFDLAQLGQIGAAIAQATREGSIQVHQGEPQTIDLRGSGLRDEILGIMREHGIDPETGAGQEIDASRLPAMQQQILEAIGRQGIDFGAFDAGDDGEVEPPGGPAAGDA